eukprot:gene14226-20198_t
MIPGVDANATPNLCQRRSLPLSTTPPPLTTAGDQSQAQLLGQVGMGRVWKLQAGHSKQRSQIPGGYSQSQPMLKQREGFNPYPSSRGMSQPGKPLPQNSFAPQLPTAPQLGPQSGNGMQWVLLPQSMLFGGNGANDSEVCSDELSRAQEWNNAKPSQANRPAMPMLNKLPNGSGSGRVDPSALLALQMLEAQIRAARGQGNDMISMQNGKTGLSSLRQASLQQGLDSSTTPGKNQSNQASTSMNPQQRQPQLAGFRVPTSQATSMRGEASTTSQLPLTFTGPRLSPSLGLLPSTPGVEGKEPSGSNEAAADADQGKKVLGMLPLIKRGYPPGDDEARKALKAGYRNSISETDAVKKIVVSNTLSSLGNQDTSRPASKLDLRSLKKQWAGSCSPKEIGGSAVQMSSASDAPLDCSAGSLQDPRFQGSNGSNDNSNNNSDDMKDTNTNTLNNNKHAAKASPQARPEKRSKTTKGSISRTQEYSMVSPSSDSSQMSQPHSQRARTDGGTAHGKDTKSKSFAGATPRRGKTSGSGSGSNDTWNDPGVLPSRRSKGTATLTI